MGLLTGDVSFRPHAPVVVMTTEVLRNMLFGRSAMLDGLVTIVLDEVHYLQDPYRGSVWEEILVLAPASIAFVCLSATVNNAREFGAWLTSVRGPTQVVVETHRPVTLQHHYAVAERGGDRVTRRCRCSTSGRANPDGLALDERKRRNSRAPLPDAPAHRGRRVPGGGGHAARHHLHLLAGGVRRRHPAVPPGRPAADHPGGAGPDPGARRGLGRAALRRRPPDPRTTARGRRRLEAGIAPHHAGLVPAFRQAVERCFSEGLLKLVFATETLALGINMPARTVVIERLRQVPGAATPRR